LTCHHFEWKNISFRLFYCSKTKLFRDFCTWELNIFGLEIAYLWSGNLGKFFGELHISVLVINKNDPVEISHFLTNLRKVNSNILRSREINQYQSEISSILVKEKTLDILFDCQKFVKWVNNRYQSDNKRQNQYNLIFPWNDTDWILYRKILYHDFSIILVLYQLNRSYWYIFYTIFIDIDFTISKPDTIFSNFDIAYVSYLAHACTAPKSLKLSLGPEYKCKWMALNVSEYDLAILVFEFHTPSQH
jgi:hypothetical protein